LQNFANIICYLLFLVSLLGTFSVVVNKYKPVEELQSRWKDPPDPRSGGVRYAPGPHITYGRNFLDACRCM